MVYSDNQGFEIIFSVLDIIEATLDAKKHDVSASYFISPECKLELSKRRKNIEVGRRYATSSAIKAAVQNDFTTISSTLKVDDSEIAYFRNIAKKFVTVAHTAVDNIELKLNAIGR
jgi:hypothetical protein